MGPRPAYQGPPGGLQPRRTAGGGSHPSLSVRLPAPGRLALEGLGSPGSPCSTSSPSPSWLPASSRMPPNVLRNQGSLDFARQIHRTQPAAAACSPTAAAEPTHV